VTTYTQSDLATRALRKAGLVGSEETPSAADLSFAEDGIASDTAALALENIFIINGSDQSVPLEHLEPRARYHAVTFKEDYGMIPPDQAAAARQVEKMTLHKLSAQEPTGSIIEADYF
jgi:hypothetical protein